jgi:2-oxo-3-hexenedioate decarboxylase
MSDIEAIADRLERAWGRAEMLEPITSGDAGFDVGRGYEVLAVIERRRRARGWSPVGRKIGFTNRGLWERYTVDRPMWAHVWANTVHRADAGRAELALRGLVQPRIEPEVVFGLHAAVPPSDDAEEILRTVAWIAPGFEIVQSHYPGWKFTAADCTAAFGLHGALIVGAPLAVTDENRRTLAAHLATFELTLRRNGTVAERGTGANVLGSPVLSLAYLSRILADQPQSPALQPGEIVTTGTLTDAWPIAPGDTWSSDYGALGIGGVECTFR